MRGLLILALAVVVPQPVFAHGGGLNSEGCHNNRKTQGSWKSRCYSSSWAATVSEWTGEPPIAARLARWGW